MKHYAFVIRKDLHKSLEDDLVTLIKNRDSKLYEHRQSLVGSDLSTSDFEFGTYTSGMYEVLGKGVIDYKVSTIRNICLSETNMFIDALVGCLGFDENSEEFQKLDDELLKLVEKYDKITFQEGMEK